MGALLNVVFTKAVVVTDIDNVTVAIHDGCEITVRVIVVVERQLLAIGQPDLPDSTPRKVSSE